MDVNWQSELAPTRTQSGKQPQDVDVVVYRVYKRRWFGLGVLMLLNIVVSWGVSSLFSSGIIATDWASEY